MRILLILVCTAFALMGAWGCSDDTSEQPQPNGCIAGTSQACACTDGSMGAQVCADDGTFGDCVCEGDPDPTDAGTDSGMVDRNACGGTDELSEVPGSTCGDCADGTVVCDGANAVRCVGGTPLNACGGCTDLRGEPGDACGPCGETGEWSCDGTDTVTCVGAATRNVCGGCGTLSGEYREACDNGAGFLSCTSEDDLLCVPLDGNRCGGTQTLTGNPGTACGECLLGKFACDGPDAVSCNDANVSRNACGGCGTLPAEPGESCGSCAGTVECNGSEGVRCNATINPCGGCGALANLPGAPCSGGVYACDGSGQTSCSSTASNACGGSETLDETPGDACGACGDGTVICAALNLTVCVDESPTNACGGCSVLPREPGSQCGPEEVIACDGTDAVVCVNESETNDCGGTTPLNQVKGSDCGDCGTWECAGPDQLTCQNEDTDPNDAVNCEACGQNCAPGEDCINSQCVTPQTGNGAWVDIELGRAHGCALNDMGEVFCWGENADSQLGTGGLQSQAEPQRVTGVTNAVDIAADGDYSCAVESTGSVKCWGTISSAVPELFAGQGRTLSTPTVIAGVDSGAQQIDADGNTICAVSGTGTAQCWGDNQYGKLGYAQLDNAGPGMTVYGLSNVAMISVGERHVCALDGSQVYCWGSDLDGRLGDGGGINNSNIPRLVDLPGQSFTHVSAGFDHTCGISSSELYCWGSDAYRQVSFGAAQSPFRVTEPGLVTLVEAGKYTTLVERFVGTMVAWGDSTGGKLGKLANGNIYGPNTVPVINGSVKDIALGDTWGCAIDVADQVWCWGTPASPERAPVLLDDQLKPSAPQFLPTRSPFVGSPGIELCTDGVDNDSDGDVDCEDLDCVDAQISGNTTISGTTSFTAASKNFMKMGTSCGNYDGVELRFLWTAPANGTYKLTGSFFNGMVNHVYYVLDSCSAGTRTQLACDTYDLQFMMGMTGFNEFTATAGQTYVIVVEPDYITSFDPSMTTDINSYSFTIGPP